MQGRGDGEVVAIVVAGSHPHEMFDGLALGECLHAHRLRATQREIPDRARTRRRPSEFGQCRGQLWIKGYLDSRPA